MCKYLHHYPILISQVATETKELKKILLKKLQLLVIKTQNKQLTFYKKWIWFNRSFKINLFDILKQLGARENFDISNLAGCILQNQ